MKKKPNETLKDGFDRAILGDFTSLTKGGCLPFVVIIIILFVVFLYIR